MTLSDEKAPETMLPAKSFLGDSHERANAVFSPYADLTLPDESIGSEQSVTGRMWKDNNYDRRRRPYLPSGDCQDA